MVWFSQALLAFHRALGFFCLGLVTMGTETALARGKHVPPHEWSEIQKQNHPWMLQVADAAHLYAFSRIT
ncbi:MAG: hypothetical protein NTZ01_00955 [Verrucomicrobia bacterium]|nr:hypothetical protein [Verrucomicrobiota bacterium]